MMREHGAFWLLVLLPLSAIWGVEFFVNQDGSVHLYNASLILEILRGNQAVSGFVTLNPVLVPNLTGHWILAFLLSIFSAAVTVKLFVSVLFAGLVASMCWLRRQVSGRDDYFTGLLLAVFLALNEMWFVGAYNFTLGMIGFAFTLGLWWRWRDTLSWRRTAVIAAVMLLVFLSHLISFGALVFSLVVSCLTNARRGSHTTAIRTGLAVLPTVPFLVSYLRLSMASAPFSPVWTYLENPWSISALLSRVKDCDPFLLLTRKSMPFIEAESKWFALVSPSVWLVIAVGCLAAATFSIWREQHKDQDRKDGSRSVLVWSGLALFFCVAWLAGPESFGQSHGWVLRQRNLLLGLICFVPAFRLGDRPTLRRVAQACLLFGIVFQSAALWNYSLYANREAKTMMAVRDHIGAGDSVGSIIVNRAGYQFVLDPRAFLVAFMAVGKDVQLWDNYELDYYLFPVVARNDADRQFAKRRGAEGVNLSNTLVPPRFRKLAAQLPTDYERIKVLLVWGREDQLDAMLSRWYAFPPFYESDEIRLFRRR